jgi:flagellar motor switch protein FliN/FliY
MDQTTVDANFEELKGEKKESQTKNDIDFLLDIPLEITVELGRTKMLIKDLLQLGQGSVVELEKMAGEPMEILVNNKLVARGEVVVVNEKFGVRLTDIISPTERIRQLK